MKAINLIAPTVLLFTIACQYRTKVADAKKPNIIYILADDLGYGDLSCYGQTRYTTPNIDKLSENGIRFTQHYSGSSVCAPSRCALLTGLHTGHTFIRGNMEIDPEGQYPMEDRALTIAEILQDAGYVTGAFGKWGLGYPGSEGDPNKQGFDEFFGFNCQRLGHNYYPFHLWHNQEKIMLKGNEGSSANEYAPEIIHREALSFLEVNKDKPFFMYYSSVIPHAELVAPLEYLKKYRGRFEPELFYKGVDGGDNFRNGPYASQSESHATFAAMINVLDDQVGEIVTQLKELGIFGNTVIIFSSDNGPHQEGGADPDYFDSNGIFKGYKRDLYEGGIRVPMIVSCPEKFKPGQVSEHVSSFWDVFPTLCELAGVNSPVVTDGISFLPALLGGNQKAHDFLYWEFHEKDGRKAIRKGQWKLVRYNTLVPERTTSELYNLETDPGEANNLSLSNPGLVEKLTNLMDSVRTPSEIFTFKLPTIIK